MSDGNIRYNISKEDFRMIIDELNFRCNIELQIKIYSGLAAFLILCAFVGTVVYKYRWDRYFMMKFHKTRKHYKIGKDESEDEDDVSYVYDAFVSYDKNDRNWVVQELIANLENSCLDESYEMENFDNGPELEEINIDDDDDDDDDGGNDNDDLVTVRRRRRPPRPSGEENEKMKSKFRLCIHERDFEAGVEIENNILNAIETSRKVILVVTKHFVKSKWCRLELEMAKCESLDRGRNLVVTIFLEPIEHRMESLTWITRRYTYLEWFNYAECRTNNLNSRKEFWQRLRLTLSSSSEMEKFVCECGKEYFANDF